MPKKKKPKIRNPFHEIANRRNSAGSMKDRKAKRISNKKHKQKQEENADAID